jgi:ArsR family transcriptional regulator
MKGMNETSPDREYLERLAERLKALAEPSRLQIVHVLDHGERCVHEIVDEVGCSQANISKHLNVLRRAGLVRRRREGTTVYYALQDDVVLAVCNLMCGSMTRQAERALQSVAGRGE